MGKNKLAKFAEMEKLPNVFQCGAREVAPDNEALLMRGEWRNKFFHNNHPIVLELGCGKGEYTVGLAQRFPEKNFIGIDIKGARMWTGAKYACENGLGNVAFLRINIEFIDRFFAADEVDEIWSTFPDPQMKKTTKRLTSTNLLKHYQQILKENGIIHLKTDSNFLYTYTCAMVKENAYPVLFETNDLYASNWEDPILSIKTYYEQQWLSRGISIKYIKFVLERRQDFVEPQIEIEHDNYRSFGRNGRTQTNTNK